MRFDDEVARSSLTLVQQRALTSKMIALRGGVERDHGPWGVATSLVFESYEAAFRDNEIDDGVLPSLTTEALSDDVARCPR